MNGLTDAAEEGKNLWDSFDLLRKALGDVSYIAAIRAALDPSIKTDPPHLYRKLWELGITGFLTLNIDRYAIRSFNTLNGAKAVSEFIGQQAGHYGSALKSGTPFVANLHGVLENPSSWVFTRTDFDNLLKSPGYREFLHTCFAARTVLFVGISADDIAAGGHLERIKNAGIDLGGHFWITTRNDADTSAWAEAAGIRQIIYNAPGNNHEELDEFFSDLRRYIPQDEPALPLIPPASGGSSVELPSPSSLSQLPANDVRQILNTYASSILATTGPGRLEAYKKFWDDYSEAIYKAWWVRPAPGHNQLFEYKLTKDLAAGSFGQVYEALNSSGDRFAIKLLHQSMKDKPEILDGFRRGVAAMRILSERKVAGMVPYFQAWEIPACTVMEMIDGPNLEQAMDSGYIKDWEMRLRIARSIVQIIRAAHQVPERVLHRDVRPANIMLKNFEHDPDNWEVVVLDFDLSWHRDALGNSVSPGPSAYGYLAPEQVDEKRRNLTRNALVDSFGVGMTLYFLVGGIHPYFAQHQHANWTDLLRNNVASKTCHEWKSLPRRMARLIEWATKNDQHARWDMTRIEGELSRLYECQHQAQNVDSAELLAEEVAGRCDYIRSHYDWDIERFTASCTLKAGFTTSIVGEESKQEIIARVEWSNAGDSHFENVRRFIGTHADKAVAELKAAGWKILQNAVSFDSCRIHVSMSVDQLRKGGALEKAGKSLSAAIQRMRM